MQGLVALQCSKSPAKLQEPQKQAAPGLPGWIGLNGSRATSHCNADASAYVARDACNCSERSWCSLITKATDRLRYGRCKGPWRRAPGNSTQVLGPILTGLCRDTFRDPQADRPAQQRLGISCAPRIIRLKARRPPVHDFILCRPPPHKVGAMKRTSLGKKSRWSCLAAILSVAACFEASSVSAQSSLKVTDGQALPLERRAQVTYDTYILGPGDGLQIELLDLPELSGVFSIGPDGTIYLPRLRALYVEGLTVEELRTFLTQQFGTYVRDPQVYVRPVAYRPTRVYVGGEVARPGYYTIRGAE